MRNCAKCGELKPPELFSKSGAYKKDGSPILKNICKKCASHRAMQYKSRREKESKMNSKIIDIPKRGEFYNCIVCGKREEFTSDVAEMEQEYEDNNGKMEKADGIACDDCYRAVEKDTNSLADALGMTRTNFNTLLISLDEEGQQGLLTQARELLAKDLAVQERRMKTVIEPLSIAAVRNVTRFLPTTNLLLVVTSD